jgi:GNAT superfamily N-acetyltransferase
MRTTVEIRAFEPEDAEAIHAVIDECLDVIDPGRHSARGIQIQRDDNLPEKLIERAKIVSYFVAVREGEPVGICGYDGEKVRGLFVKVSCQRQGIAAALLERVLELAQASGASEIRTWSTEYAVGFYERFGFERVRDIYPGGTGDVGLIETVKLL